MIVYSDTTPDFETIYDVHETPDFFYVSVSTSNDSIKSLVVFNGTLDECVNFINKNIK
jgi:hypothetical protein